MNIIFFKYFFKFPTSIFSTLSFFSFFFLYTFLILCLCYCCFLHCALQLFVPIFSLLLFCLLSCKGVSKMNMGQLLNILLNWNFSNNIIVHGPHFDTWALVWRWPCNLAVRAITYFLSTIFVYGVLMCMRSYLVYFMHDN